MSVANKGGSDLEAHVHSAKHKTAARGESSSSKVTDFFVSKTDTSVTAAEGTLAFHTIKLFVIVLCDSFPLQPGCLGDCFILFLIGWII